MKRNELLARIEEATDANLSDYASREPEDAAAILIERAEANEALAKEGVTLTFETIRRDTEDLASNLRNLASNLRNLAAELRMMVEASEAA